MDGATMEYWLFFNRWLHFLSGITWIGILYYFNFVQTPFFSTELGGQARSPVVRGLVPEALWWFRWGAMFTFLTGWLIILTRWGHEGIPLSSPYMTKILTGGLLGTIMWANVWFIIWPAQKVVIASANQVAGGGQADPRSRRTRCSRRARLANQHAALDRDAALHGRCEPSERARRRRRKRRLLDPRPRSLGCSRSQCARGAGSRDAEASRDGARHHSRGSRRGRRSCS